MASTPARALELNHGSDAHRLRGLSVTNTGAQIELTCDERFDRVLFELSRKLFALESQMAEERAGAVRALDSLAEELQTRLSEQAAVQRRLADLELTIEQHLRARDALVQELASAREELVRAREAESQVSAELQRERSLKRQVEEALNLECARRAQDKETFEQQLRSARKRFRSAHSLLTWLKSHWYRKDTNGTGEWKSAASKIRASGLFRPLYYLQRYPDVVAAEMDPFEHYVKYGAYEGRVPHPLFDPSYYLLQLPEENRQLVNPLLHYIDQGTAKGLDPHPLFDTDYYLAMNPDVSAAGVNPLSHYLEEGWREGRNPCPLFDTSFYLEQHSTLLAMGENPLVHYVTRAAPKCKRV